MSFVLTVSEDKVPVIAEVDPDKYEFEQGMDVWMDESKLKEFFDSVPCEFDNVCGVFHYSAAPSNKNPMLWVAQKGSTFNQIRDFIIENNFMVR